jgi:hypothetical protein
MLVYRLTEDKQIRMNKKYSCSTRGWRCALQTKKPRSQVLAFVESEEHPAIPCVPKFIEKFEVINNGYWHLHH